MPSSVPGATVAVHRNATPPLVLGVGVQTVVYTTDVVLGGAALCVFNVTVSAGAESTAAALGHSFVPSSAGNGQPSAPLVIDTIADSSQLYGA